MNTVVTGQLLSQQILWTREDVLGALVLLWLQGSRRTVPGAWCCSLAIAAAAPGTGEAVWQVPPLLLSLKQPAGGARGAFRRGSPCLSCPPGCSCAGRCRFSPVAEMLAGKNQENGGTEGVQQGLAAFVKQQPARPTRCPGRK